MKTNKSEKEEFDTNRLNGIINTLTGMGIVGKTDINLLHEAQGIMINLDEYCESVILKSKVEKVINRILAFAIYEKQVEGDSSKYSSWCTPDDLYTFCQDLKSKLLGDKE